MLDSHFAVHFKKEFRSADVGHHNDGRQSLQAPGRGPFPINLGVLRMLDEDRGGDHICQGGPRLTKEHLNLLKGAVDLGSDIVGMEALSLFTYGRGAGDLDQ